MHCRTAFNTAKFTLDSSKIKTTIACGARISRLSDVARVFANFVDKLGETRKDHLLNVWENEFFVLLPFNYSLDRRSGCLHWDPS